MDMNILKEAQTKLSQNGDIRIVHDQSTLGKSIEQRAYKLTSIGLVKYKTFRNDVLEILCDYGITRTTEQTAYINLIARNLSCEASEINKDAESLLATPDGRCIDLAELNRILKTGQDYEKEYDRWNKSIREYDQNNITLRTGANYTPHFANGKQAILEYLKMALYDNSEEMIEWVVKFFARLLNGTNRTKEYVRLLGEMDSGKTTISKFVSISLLGDYSGKISDNVFYGSGDSDTSVKKLYALQHCRVLYHTEAKTKLIHTEQIKSITGGSPMTYNGCNFSMRVKILDDGNTFPKYGEDNEFEKRMYIILFKKNIDVSSSVIDSVIKNLEIYKDEVFSYLIHVSAKNFDAEIPARPDSMQFVQQWFKYCDKPVQAFYEIACTRNAAFTSTPASEVYTSFQKWISLYLKPHIANIPLLNELTPTIPTETEFNREMTTLHGLFTPHTNTGAAFHCLEIKEEKLYW
jgi:hypothetical protein